MADAKENEVAALGIKAVQDAKQAGLGSTFSNCNWEPVGLKLQKDGTYVVLARLGRQRGFVDRN